MRDSVKVIIDGGATSKDLADDLERRAGASTVRLVVTRKDQIVDVQSPEKGGF